MSKAETTKRQSVWTLTSRRIFSSNSAPPVMFIALGEKSVHPATLVSPSSSTRDVHVSTAYPAKKNTVSPGRHLIDFEKRDALASDRMMLNRKRLAGSAVLIFSMYSDVNMLTPRWPSAKSMTA